jgi:hypothetical protein
MNEWCMHAGGVQGTYVSWCSVEVTTKTSDVYEEQRDISAVPKTNSGHRLIRSNLKRLRKNIRNIR